MKTQTVNVLLVEDDPGDVLLVREAFAEREPGARLEVVGDGEEAMRYVRGEGAYAGRERPDLILLDLNLPRKNGAEVLAELKDDAAFTTIPVVILTTSEAEEDVLGAYRRHANAYITKPPDFVRFREIVHRIDEFFADVVELPPRPARPA